MDVVQMLRLRVYKRLIGDYIELSKKVSQFEGLALMLRQTTVRDSVLFWGIQNIWCPEQNSNLRPSA